MADHMRDEIRLDVPASGAFARIARVAAASLGVRLRLPHPVIEDLRLAVDEAVVLLLASAAPDDTISARYLLDDRSVEVTLQLGVARRLPAEAVARFESIVADLAPRAELDAAVGRVTLRLAPPPGDG